MPFSNTVGPGWDISTGSWTRSTGDSHAACVNPGIVGGVVTSPNSPGAWALEMGSGNFLPSIDKATNIVMGVEARAVSGGTVTLAASLTNGSGVILWQQNITLSPTLTIYTYSVSASGWGYGSGTLVWTLAQGGLPRIEVAAFSATFSDRSDLLTTRVGRRGGAGIALFD